MLTTRVFTGAGWLVASRLVGRAVDFGTLLVLARVLGPTDFGLTALAASLIFVVDMIFEVPLAQALTRLRSISDAHLDTAFTLGLLRSLMLAVVLLAAAWPFSVFYADARLFPLILVLATGPVTRALSSPAMVRAIRQVRFHQVFIIEVTGKLLAATLATLVLWRGGGYWSIAVNSIAAPVIATVVSYLVAPYRPRLTLSQARSFAGFLGWFSSAQLLAALNFQFDRVLLGHVVSRAALGQYTMASDLAVLPTQSLIGPAMQPVMAAFSTMSDDAERVRRAYLKASFLSMMLAMPMCVGISVTADVIVDTLLGPKWEQAAVYLQFLPMTILLNAYYQVLSSLALASDRPRLLFRLKATELALAVALLPLGLHFFSVGGVIAARGIQSAAGFCMALHASRALSGAGIKQQLLNLRQVIVACAGMGFGVIALRTAMATLHLSAPVTMVGAAGFGAIVYGALLLRFGINPVRQFGLRPGARA